MIGSISDRLRIAAPAHYAAAALHARAANREAAIDSRHVHGHDHRLLHLYARLVCVAPHVPVLFQAEYSVRFVQAMLRAQATFAGVVAFIEEASTSWTNIDFLFNRMALTLFLSAFSIVLFTW